MYPPPPPLLPPKDRVRCLGTGHPPQVRSVRPSCRLPSCRPAVPGPVRQTFSPAVPSVGRRFYASQAKAICESVTASVLDKKAWRGEEEPLWSVQIAEHVKARIKQEMNIPRYKIVVQVIIGEMKDQGVRVASKCLWDADTDNYASCSYRNVRPLPAPHLATPPHPPTPTPLVSALLRGSFCTVKHLCSISRLGPPRAPVRVCACAAPWLAGGSLLPWLHTVCLSHPRNGAGCALRARTCLLESRTASLVSLASAWMCSTEWVAVLRTGWGWHGGWSGWGVLTSPPACAPAAPFRSPLRAGVVVGLCHGVLLLHGVRGDRRSRHARR